MKKTITALLVIIAILMAAAYFFIPSSITINKTVDVANNTKAVYRCFSNAGNWQKWWPQKTTAAQSLVMDENTYTIQYSTAVSIFIDIHSGSLQVPSALNFLPAGNHTQLNWNAAINTSKNPFTRLQQYFAAKNIEQQIGVILKHMSEFGSSTANLYALDIKREFVKDSALVSLHDSSTGFPSSAKIYALVQQLRDYVNLQHTTVIDSPMLNIFTKDKIHYQFKVALPTSRPLPSAGKIEYKWMLPGGNILAADVKGGQQAIDKAFAIIEEYIEDYELKAPAIPFYTLLTNRNAEPDSSKWITRIYYPVMYYHE